MNICRWQLAECGPLFVVHEEWHTCVCPPAQNHRSIESVGHEIATIQIFNCLGWWIGVRQRRWNHSNRLLDSDQWAKWGNCQLLSVCENRSAIILSFFFHLFSFSRPPIIRASWLAYRRDICNFSTHEAPSCCRSNGTRNRFSAFYCKTKLEKPSKKFTWFTNRVCAFCRANN